MALALDIVAPDGTTIAYVMLESYRFYLIDNDSLRRIDETVAYCWSCQQFVPSEWILTAQYITDRLDWLQARFRAEPDKSKFMYGTWEDNARRLREQEAFYHQRRSPPRCLDCGSTEILQAIDDVGNGPDRLLHPDYLPQGLTIKPAGWASPKSFYRLFSTEGEDLKLEAEEIIDLVNRHEGKRSIAMMKDGKLFYGRSFEEP